MYPTRTSILASFTWEFRIHLEYHLSNAFQNNRTDQFNCMRCDGILEPRPYEQDPGKPNWVFTMGHLGYDGQSPYKMYIKLGKKSIEYCRWGLSLVYCLPADDTLNWVNLDMENAEIELRLR